VDKSFIIILIAIGIIGFFSSAYFFSENQIIANFDLMSNFSSDKSEYINLINKCIDDNTTADGSIALNSFSASLLHDLKIRAQNAENIAELESILTQVYKTTSCKP